MNNKPHLVFVHGMFGNEGQFTEWIEFFKSKGYQSTAITLPEHDTYLWQNPSPKLAQLGILEYVDYVCRQIEKIEGEYVIIGHSMGGLISLKAACLPEIHPKAVILLAPASPSGIMAFRLSVLKTFGRVMRQSYFWEKPMKLTFEEVCYAMLNKVNDNGLQRKIYKNMVWESGKAAFQIGFWPLDPAKATKVEPKNLTCPVTIISGTADMTTPYSVVKQIYSELVMKPNLIVRIFEKLWFIVKRQEKHSQFSRIRLVPLPNIGHWLLTEMPVETLFDEIEQILK